MEYVQIIPDPSELAEVKKLANEPGDALEKSNHLLGQLANREDTPIKLNCVIDKLELTQQEWLSRASAHLTNIVIDHMMENGLTLEVLDRTYEDVKRMFYRDAKLKNRKRLT